MEAVKLASYTDNVVLGTDAAPSEFCTKDKEFKYDLNKLVKSDDPDDAKKETMDSVEDSHDEEYWKGWAAFNKQLAMGDKFHIVDDNLLVTNLTPSKRRSRGSRARAVAQSKPNRHPSEPT